MQKLKIPLLNVMDETSNMSRVGCDRPIKNITMDDSSINLTVPREPRIAMMQALNGSIGSSTNNNLLEDDLRKGVNLKLVRTEANRSEDMSRKGKIHSIKKRPPKKPAESSMFINSKMNQKLIYGP